MTVCEKVEVEVIKHIDNFRQLTEVYMSYGTYRTLQIECLNMRYSYQLLTSTKITGIMTPAGELKIILDDRLPDGMVACYPNEIFEYVGNCLDKELFGGKNGLS